MKLISQIIIIGYIIFGYFYQIRIMNQCEREIKYKKLIFTFNTIVIILQFLILYYAGALSELTNGNNN